MALDKVVVRRGEEEIGHAFVINHFHAVAKPGIFNNSSAVGLNIEFTLSMPVGRVSYQINWISHPSCENIRDCSPKVAVIKVAENLPRRGKVNHIFHEEFTPVEIEWAYNEIARDLFFPRYE